MSDYNEIESLYLSTLKECLNEVYSSFIFQIGKFKEGAYCLEKGKNGWEIYCGERGQKSDYTVIPDLEQACLDFISYMTYTEEDRTQITAKFKNIIEKRKINNVATVTIRAVVAKGQEAGHTQHRYKLRGFDTVISAKVGRSMSKPAKRSHYRSPAMAAKAMSPQRRRNQKSSAIAAKAISPQRRRRGKRVWPDDTIK